MESSFYNVVFGDDTESSKIAIQTEDSSLTYLDLFNKVENYSNRIGSLGMLSGSRVVIHMKRSPEYIITILALSKLGITFIPVDISYPKERIDFIIKDCEANAIITDYEYGDTAVSSALTIDENINLVINFFNNKTKCDKTIAYIIYTSGSTGKPKGVQISNKGFNYLKGLFDEKLNLDEKAKILQFASISFDASIWEISMALMNHLTLVLASSKDKTKIERLIRNFSVTVATLPPSYAELLSEDIISNLDLLITAGSEPHKKLFKKIDLERTRYINAYGPTECTVCACLWEAEDFQQIEASHIPIGNISQENLHINTDGELYVSGDGVSEGYLNRDNLNKKCFFIQNGVRFYKTGDIVKTDLEGNIYFQGRNDNQIKFNGYRIELEEIERTLFNVDSSIKDAAVMVINDTLVCFYNGKVDVSEVKKGMNKRLPYYMVPTLFQYVESFEYNTSGKIDRSKLRIKNDESKSKDSKRSIEGKLERILSEILPVEINNKDENLMESGLNSLGMINLTAKLKRDFNVDISIEEISKNCSFNHLVKLISISSETQELKEQNEIIHDVENENEWFPLTNIQESYLLGRNNYSEMGGYGTHGYFEIKTQLDPVRLSDSLNTVISSQGMLRAIFSEDLQQKILPNTLKYQIDILDMSTSPQEEINKEIEKRRDKLSHQIFDYTKWPLFEINALRIRDGYTILFISIDGLLADAKSMQIFASQWLSAYKGADSKELAPQVSFRDYIMNDNIGEKNKEDAKLFWLEKMDGLPESPKIIDNNVKQEGSNLFSRESLFFNKEIWGLIKDYCHNNHVTPTAFFIQVYFDTLARWSQNKQFTINLSIFNRKNIHKDIEKMIGDFTSNLFIDNRYQDTKDSFSKKVTLLQRDIFSSIDNKSFDGIDFLRAYAKKKKRNLIVPYVVTSLISEDITKQAADYLGEMTYGISQTPQVYIDMQMSNSKDGILINWDYSTRKFTKEFMKKIIEVFEKNVTSVLSGEDDIASQLPRDDKRIVSDYNSTDVPYDSCRLEQLLFKTAKKYPNNIAIKDHNSSFTYSQLKQEVIQRASEISKTIRKTGQKIGIIDYRNCQTIIDLISILYSGNTYVPIEKDCPPDRLTYIKEIAEISYMVDEINQTGHVENIDEISDDKQLAYVIFTSGSTGKPKGVAVSHESVVNTIIDINKRFKLNNDDRFILLSSLSFDLSVFDIFGSLSVGGSLYIVEDRRDIEEIHSIINRERITVWNSVPSTMKAYLNYSYNKNIDISRVDDKLNNSINLNQYIDEQVVFNKEASERYKTISTNRFVISDYSKKVQLPLNTSYPDFIINRKSTRRFNNSVQISAEQFFKVVSSLGRVKVDEKSHYLYPSAGGLYPIDIYISVEDGKVAGVRGGVYYYNPTDNSLYKISERSLESKVHFYGNQRISESSSFTIVLVYNSEANIRKYGSEGYKYALIDSGYLGQHLTTVGTLNNISSCVIGSADKALISERLHLSSHQTFLNCIIFGGSNQLECDLSEMKSNYVSLLGSSEFKNSTSNSLRVIMLSGDYIPLDLPDKIFDRIGRKVSLYSLGGATECSIWSIYYPITKVEPEWKTIPYGYPLGNQKIWIMDKDLNICPVDVLGEIVIGGFGVGEEYLNNPSKTLESFVEHLHYGKIYKTGDLGVLRKDGVIEFMGRIDNQVKINGYRVELPEIEKVIKDNCNIQDVVAIIDKTDDGNNKLVCFVQCDISSNLYEYIIERIKNELPVYMIPQEIHKIDKIPITENGKVDKKKLLNQSKVVKEISIKPSSNSFYETTVSESSNSNNHSLLLEVRQIFSAILEVNDFSNDDTIFDLGGNSINIVTIQKQLEKKYGVTLKIIDIFENNTVNKLVKFLDSKNKLRVVGARFKSTFFANRSGSEVVEEKIKLIGGIENKLILEALILILLDIINNNKFDLFYNCDSYNSNESKILRLNKELLELNKENLDTEISRLVNQSRFEVLSNLINDEGTTISYTNLFERYKTSNTDLAFYFDEETLTFKVKFDSCRFNASSIRILCENVSKVSTRLM